MQHLPMRAARRRGFTLVELVVVMVVMGILGAIGAARFFDRKAFDAVEFADQAKAMLRYAQKVAIAQNRPVFVRLDGAGIALCFNLDVDAGCGAANRLIPAAGFNDQGSATLAACQQQSAWYCIGVPAGLAYALAPAAAYIAPRNYFYFDAQGKPYSATDTVGNDASTFSPLLIRITGDGTNHDVTVEQETGYVH